MLLKRMLFSDSVESMVLQVGERAVYGDDGDDANVYQDDSKLSSTLTFAQKK